MFPRKLNIFSDDMVISNPSTISAITETQSPIVGTRPKVAPNSRSAKLSKLLNDF